MKPPFHTIDNGTLIHDARDQVVAAARTPLIAAYMVDLLNAGSGREDGPVQDNGEETSSAAREIA